VSREGEEKAPNLYSIVRVCLLRHFNRASIRKPLAVEYNSFWLSGVIVELS